MSPGHDYAPKKYVPPKEGQAGKGTMVEDVSTEHVPGVGAEACARKAVSAGWNREEVSEDRGS